MASKPMSDRERQFVEALGASLGLLVVTAVRAIDAYLDTFGSDEPVGADQRRAIMIELMTVAAAFRVADAHREVLEQLTGELDPKPALALLRVVQDSLMLSLSADPRDRSRRIGAEELRARVNEEPVKRFLDQRPS
jgi:hypothetical protein